MLLHYFFFFFAMFFIAYGTFVLRNRYKMSREAVRRQIFPARLGSELRRMRIYGIGSILSGIAIGVVLLIMVFTR